jgi:hypothetical protein
VVKKIITLIKIKNEEEIFNRFISDGAFNSKGILADIK